MKRKLMALIMLPIATTSDTIFGHHHYPLDGLTLMCGCVAHRMTLQASVFLGDGFELCVAQ